MPTRQQALDSLEDRVLNIHYRSCDVGLELDPMECSTRLGPAFGMLGALA